VGGEGPGGEEATRLIRELAESQHGVVARRQLIALGLGKGLIQERRRTRLLVPIHRGVYSVGHSREDVRHRWAAAVLACGDRAALSHRSAAQLWDLRGSRGPIEVARTSGGGRRHGLLIRQVDRLPAAEVTLAGGIRVTTVERTLLDLATFLDDLQLGRAFAAAERSGRLRWSALRRLLEAPGGRAGMSRLRRVAAQADPRAVEALSGIEVDFLALCGDAGLPAPQVNVLLHGHLVDFLWPARRLIVELDSFRFHGDRLAFERDHDSTLVLEAAGYRVLRVTEQRLAADPTSFLNHLAPALGPKQPVFHP
jgi:hypothetical protein